MVELRMGLVLGAGAVAVTLVVMRRIGRTGPYYPSFLTRVLALPLPPRDTAFRFSVPTCASGMEPVLEAFKGLFEQGHNLEAQLCIYSKGQKVLDAAGCARANSTYDTTTLQNCLSCTKVIAAIAVARLVERGSLQYSDLVVKHWPKFAKEDPTKATITIADLLRHDSGLACFGTPAQHQYLTMEHLNDPAKLSDFLERQPRIHYPKGIKRAYHGLYAGFHLNEVVRRADPQGRTIGTIVMQDVVGKLKVPYYIGQGRPPMGPDGVLHTVQPSSPPRWWWALWVVWARLLMGCVPTQPAIKPLGNIKKSPAYFNCVKMTLIYAKNLLDAHRMLWGIGLGFNHGPRGTIKVFNSEEFHKVEVPGANGISSGAAMAKIGAMLSGRGAVTGSQACERVMSQQTWEKMMGERVKEKDEHIGVVTEFSQGGMADMSSMVDWLGHYFDGFYGWCGWGGSWLIFNPELDVSIGMAITGWKHEIYEDQRLVQILAALKPVLASMQQAQ